jgi:endonuclease/exonuclease/phosphatase family metal-dependent hydrolase
MRWLLISAAVATVVAAAHNPAVRLNDAGTLKVMTFNIQHGIDGSHKYNLQRAIDVIAKIQPDIVGLQEVTRNHPYYNCDDQPAKIAQGLKAATGRAWSVAYEQEWFTPNVECQQNGRGDGKETEGLALLAPAPLGPTSMTPLPVSRIAFAVKLQQAGGLPIVVTHLASGRGNSEARHKEIEALMTWTQKLGAAQILIGDFNAKPSDREIQPVLTMFQDAWQVGSQASMAVGSESTHGQNRIDYIFFRPEGLDLTGIQTVATAGWFTTEASDHKPLVATFRVKPRP